MSSRLTERQWAILDLLVGALAVALPCLPLLRLSDSFYLDWYNHCWAIGYYAEHMRQRGAVPVMFNTITDAGIAEPIFYGYLFYPIAGLISIFTGPPLALRLLAVGALALQYALANSTLKKMGSERPVATLVAALVTWALYPLTNLYNRTALAEFFAVCLLTCAVFAWFQCLLAADRRGRWLGASGFTLLFCLSFGFHPITAMLGTLFIIPLMGATILVERSWSCLAAVAGFSVPALVVTLPWLYAVVKESAGLLIAQYSSKWGFYPLIDTLLTRLLPIDRRIFDGTDLGTISTPYLDATINGPLLIIFVAALFCVSRGLDAKARSRVLIPTALVTLEIAIFFLFVSIDPGLAESLPAFLSHAQFGYRLVSYIDLTVLCGLLFLVYWVYLQKGRVRLPMPALAGTTVIALALLAVKLSHAEAVRNTAGPAYTPDLLIEHIQDLPKTFNGYPDYMQALLYEPIDNSVAGAMRVPIVPEKGLRFGELAPLKLSLARPDWVMTNVQPFAWTHFYLDGKELHASELRLAHYTRTNMAEGALHFQHLFVAFKTSAGEHVIEARVEPPLFWARARTVAFAVLTVWIAAMAYFMVRRFRCV